MPRISVNLGRGLHLSKVSVVQADHSAKRGQQPKVLIRV